MYALLNLWYWIDLNDNDLKTLYIYCCINLKFINLLSINDVKYINCIFFEFVY